MTRVCVCPVMTGGHVHHGPHCAMGCRGCESLRGELDSARSTYAGLALALMAAKDENDALRAELATLKGGSR